MVLVSTNTQWLYAGYHYDGDYAECIAKESTMRDDWESKTSYQGTRSMCEWLVNLWKLPEEEHEFYEMTINSNDYPGEEFSGGSMIYWRQMPETVWHVYQSSSEQTDYANLFLSKDMGTDAGAYPKLHPWYPIVSYKTKQELTDRARKHEVYESAEAVAFWKTAYAEHYSWQYPNKNDRQTRPRQAPIKRKRRVRVQNRPIYAPKVVAAILNHDPMTPFVGEPSRVV